MATYIALCPVPMAIFTFTMLYPCMPPLITGLIYWTKDATCSLNLVSKIVIGLLESYTWCMKMVMGFPAIYFFLIHPGCVQIFLLEEIHRKLTSGLYTEIRKYRYIQTLSLLQNELLKQPGIQVLVGGIIITETVSIYMVFRSWQILPLPALGFFGIIATSFFFTIHVYFKAISNPFVKSVELVRFGGQMRNKWVQAYLRSCSPIRVSLGDGSYFGKITSLKIWQYCMDRLEMILLL
ncbi:uncharacterized protein LOC118434070 [Folsomia candida]|nr:uncharacterized protein LOC118434070 [Folsomia candida]